MLYAQKDRRSITALLRKFAIREDREELGTNTGPRFKSELINPRKGTPTSYIAKYISKNIDGRGLAKEISKETGRSLRDSAEHVSARASLHRVQQFRFFGIPGRQHTASCACWLVRRREYRANAKRVRLYWIIHVWMRYWRLQMRVALPPTS